MPAVITVYAKTLPTTTKAIKMIAVSRPVMPRSSLAPRLMIVRMGISLHLRCFEYEAARGEAHRSKVHSAASHFSARRAVHTSYRRFMIAFRLCGTTFSIVNCAPCTGLISIVNGSKFPSRSLSMSKNVSLESVPKL